jgi:hypothetical protein
MFIRIVSGIQDHFPDRALEWVCAANIVYWGARLTGENDAWVNPDAWRFMLSFGLTENQWGWICVAIGVMRLLALIINGTFAGTWYSAASPWVRGITAGAGAAVWFAVFLSVNSVQTSGGAIYQLPLVLDLWCSLRMFYVIGRATPEKAPKGHARVT